MQYLTSRNMSSIATPKIHKMGNSTPTTAVVDSTPWMQPSSTAMTDQYYSSSSHTSPLLNSDNDNLYLSESNTKSHRSRTSTSDMCVEKNTEGKPPYSYATLIKYAIERSAENKLTLSQIYQWVIDHYPYYGSAGSGWKVCSPMYATTTTRDEMANAHVYRTLSATTSPSTRALFVCLVLSMSQARGLIGL